MSTRKLVRCGLVAALYGVLCMALQPLSFGAVQIRFAEALVLLPVFGAEYIAAAVLGCFLSNLLGSVLPDVIFGTLATLLAACITAQIPAKLKWLAPLPPVIANAVIVGALLAWYEAGFGPAFPTLYTFNAVTVGLGELIACYVFGGVVLTALPKIKSLRDMIPNSKL